jgi:hypothetical protein
MLAMLMRWSDRQRCDAFAVEFDGVVEHFIWIEQAAQRDDHIFPDDAGLSAPRSVTRAIGGTCHHVTPVAQMLAASVRTTGVPSALTHRTDSNANHCPTTSDPA